MDPERKSLNFIFPTKYVIPKSLKFSHWPSKLLYQFHSTPTSDTTHPNLRAPSFIHSIPCCRFRKKIRCCWLILKGIERMDTRFNPCGHKGGADENSLFAWDGPGWYAYRMVSIPSLQHHQFMSLL